MFSTTVRSHSAFVNFTLNRLRIMISGGYEEKIEKARHNNGDLILEELLRRFNKICIDRGVSFLATAYTLQKDDLDIKERCSKAGVCFISIEQGFIEKSKSYKSLRIDGRYDGHYGPKGTEAAV